MPLVAGQVRQRSSWSSTAAEIAHVELTPVRFAFVKWRSAHSLAKHFVARVRRHAGDLGHLFVSPGVIGGGGGLSRREFSTVNRTPRSASSASCRSN
jgi:hypothetical protein